MHCVNKEGEMSVETISYINLFVGAVIAGLLLMFRTYAAEKGKHLATKEDHDETLKQLKDTKTLVLQMETEQAQERGYRETLGQQLATKQNFAELQAQLKAQTIAVETIKADFLREIEVFKADLQWQQQIAGARLAALRALWALTETLRFHTEAELSIAQRKELATKLTDWYYRDGNGMLLPIGLSAHLLLVRKMLIGDDAVAAIQRVVSGVRTSLKEQIGVYSREDAQISIADLQTQLKAKYAAGRA
jgi:hypothetical protein